MPNLSKFRKMFSVDVVSVFFQKTSQMSSTATPTIYVTGRRSKVSRLIQLVMTIVVRLGALAGVHREVVVTFVTQVRLFA